MLKVFTKTKREIEKLKAEDRFYARTVKGKPQGVCETYVITKDGQKVDTSALTEKQILSFVSQGILTSADKTKTTGKLNTADLQEAHKLIKCVESTYKPSWEGYGQILQLFQNQDNNISSWSRDILTPICKEKSEESYYVAKHCKEIEGDFSKVTNEEIKNIVDQKIELYKNKQLSSTV